MAGVHSAKEGECLFPPNLAQYDAIRTHTQRGIKEIFGRRERFTQRAARRKQSNRVVMLEFQLGSILDQDQSLVSWYLAQ